MKTKYQLFIHYGLNMNKWLGKFDIVDEKDKHDLERDSALHEFHHGMSRDQSENLAYQKYKKKQHLIAAAHHLDGIDDCKANGKAEDAKKYLAMYLLHLNALGMDPYSPINPEISGFRQPDRTPTENFKSHSADIFALIKK